MENIILLTLINEGNENTCNSILVRAETKMNLFSLNINALSIVV